MPNAKVAGRLSFKINGELQYAKGNFTYNLGADKREGIVGADVIHGYKETPQIPFLEGEITHHSDLDLSALVNIVDATVSLEMANAQTFVLRSAWFAGEGTGNTDEANVAVRFEGKSAEMV